MTIDDGAAPGCPRSTSARGRDTHRRAGLAALITGALALVSLIPAAPARADTGTGTGRPTPVLAGTWVSDTEPWVRVVFDGAGQGHLEEYPSDGGGWRRVERGCGQDEPEFRSVTGSARAYTGEARHHCVAGGDGTSGSVVYTQARFDIGHSGNALTLAVTWGLLTDEWQPDFTNSFTRRVDAPPPPPWGDGPPPEDQVPPGVTCGEGAAAITMSWPDVLSVWDTVSASGAFDEARMAAVESDPCLLWRGVSFGQPTATTVAEYQHSEPVAGSAARIWRCARFDVTWPIRGPFGGPTSEPVGWASTVTDACTDGKVLKGGDPTRDDPPATNVVTVSLQAPYDSLWSHSPTGAAVGRYTDGGAYWEFRQIVQYSFLHLPTGEQDIVYTYILGLPQTPDGPPRLFWTSPQ